MPSKHLDADKIKKELLLFTKDRVTEFLKANSNLTFYAFAFDCNAEYPEVNLCFNTESSFKKLCARINRANIQNAINQKKT